MPQQDRGAVPRVINLMWLQGAAVVPPLLRHNLGVWANLNPGYEIRLHDRRAADRLLVDSRLADLDVTPQTLSNAFRLCLLAQEGGIWADASLLPICPLDAWLPERLGRAGFFAFDRPGPDRPLSTWFLAATPGHPLILPWRDALLRFWDRPRRLIPGIPADPVASIRLGPSGHAGEYPYFACHYLFRQLLESQPDFARNWADCAPLPAFAAHGLQYLLHRKPAASLAEMANAAQMAPLQKLDWRVDYRLDDLDALTGAVVKPVSV